MSDLFKEMTAMKTHYKTQLDQLETQYLSQQRQIEQKETQIDQLETQYLHQQRQIKQLSSANEHKDQPIDTFKLQSTAKHTKIETLESNVKTLQDDLVNLEVRYTASEKHNVMRRQPLVMYASVDGRILGGLY